MTDEEIRKLATQFADELFKDDDMSDSGNIDEYHDVWEICNSFGNFLLEKFCIVEKDVIRSDYADIKKALADWKLIEKTERDEYFDYGRVLGNKEVLDSYFSKEDLIGKEVKG
ncbi:MAG: hypothetical protein K2N48_01335 [Muribaculaceae bacterium]|nr:hypothetical protein [Muribaculaceae bacterium]